MPLFVKMRSFLRNLFLSRRVEADLDNEVRSHLELMTAENMRAGMGPEEAVVAIIALALGIGFSTIIFSIFYNGVLHPFPYRDAERFFWEL